MRGILQCAWHPAGCVVSLHLNVHGIKCVVSWAWRPPKPRSLGASFSEGFTHSPRLPGPCAGKEVLQEVFLEDNFLREEFLEEFWLSAPHTLPLCALSLPMTQYKGEKIF